MVFDLIGMVHDYIVNNLGLHDLKRLGYKSGRGIQGQALRMRSTFKVDTTTSYRPKWMKRSPNHPRYKDAHVGVVGEKACGRLR